MSCLPVWRALTILIVVICGVAFRGNALAQSDQIVYIDAPGSGWQNWSWATVNLTNTQPVQGGSDSIAVNAGAYQALYLHQTAFDSTPYNNLVFWINGGVERRAVATSSSDAEWHGANGGDAPGARGEYVVANDDSIGVAWRAKQAEYRRILDSGSQRDDAADILR